MTTTEKTERYEIQDEAGNRWTQVVRRGLNVSMDYATAVRRMCELAKSRIGIGQLRIVRIED